MPNPRRVRRLAHAKASAEKGFSLGFFDELVPGAGSRSARSSATAVSKHLPTSGPGPEAKRSQSISCDTTVTPRKERWRRCSCTS